MQRTRMTGLLAGLALAAGLAAALPAQTGATAAIRPIRIAAPVDASGLDAKAPARTDLLPDSDDRRTDSCAGLQAVSEAWRLYRAGEREIPEGWLMYRAGRRVPTRKTPLPPPIFSDARPGG